MTEQKHIGRMNAADVCKVHFWRQTASQHVYFLMIVQYSKIDDNNDFVPWPKYQCVIFLFLVSNL